MRAGLIALLLLIASSPLTAQSKDVELRGLVYGAPSERNSAFDASTLLATSGTMLGGEAGIRTKWFGATGRLLSGNLEATGGANKGTVAVGELGAEAGPRVAAFTLGLGRRAIGGQLGSTAYSYLTIGAASVLEIGGTGLSARTAVSIYVTGSVSGQVVSTALEYQLRGSPLLFTLGYRGEVFSTTSGVSERSEHLSGVIIGGGISLGR